MNYYIDSMVTEANKIVSEMQHHQLINHKSRNFLYIRIVTIKLWGSNKYIKDFYSLPLSVKRWAKHVLKPIQPILIKDKAENVKWIP